MFRHFICALVLGAASASLCAASAAPAERFRLTPALLDRMEAVQAASQAIAHDSEDQDVDAQSVEELARALEADPRIRSLLARHKITSTDYAAAVFAAVHAGAFLAMESAARKKDLAAALASFTPEQRANIEVLRSRKK
ncbi:conserved hypothetical protein [Acidovorax delafieldii 2AN]|uniref:DUF4168 domain-containing protein n=1 Tax=Acidovorax delafieldii 2AN TaxID=573060 RepID=C5T2L4_ACIDE|nr:hypothetical protein [Acidovorax delafieldii]EER61259.1 conserved hypothetical protein [Acidovorax delafieldii 2AN]